MPGFPVVLVYVCLPSAATRVPAPFSTIIARVFRTKAAAMRPRAAAEAAGPAPEAAEIFGAAGAAVPSRILCFEQASCFSHMRRKYRLFRVKVRTASEQIEKAAVRDYIQTVSIDNQRFFV